MLFVVAHDITTWSAYLYQGLLFLRISAMWPSNSTRACRDQHTRARMTETTRAASSATMSTLFSPEHAVFQPSLAACNQSNMSDEQVTSWVGTQSLAN